MPINYREVPIDKELKVSLPSNRVKLELQIRCSHVSGTASRNTKRQVEQPLRLINLRAFAEQTRRHPIS